MQVKNSSKIKIILIKKLKNCKDFVSKDFLKNECNLSNEKLNLLIKQLESEGYRIVFHPHFGYRLEGLPDKLDFDLIKANLDTKFIGGNLYIFDTVDSTNDKILDFVSNSCKEGMVVLAERQGKGRGKNGRSWISPAGGIYFSVLLKPNINFNQVGVFNLISSTAIVEVLREFYDIPVSIKWPNDVFFKDKKIAGVLSEIKKIKGIGNILIIGVGINIDIASDFLPSEAISLSEIGFSSNRAVFLCRVCKSLELQYRLYQNEEFLKIMNNWRTYSNLLGKQIKVTTCTEKVIEGYVSNIDPKNGGLILRLDNGLEKIILEGTVKLLT